MRGLLNQEKDRRLVQTVIDLAIRLEYRVVAEGIENGETLNLVRSWGCHEGQGYHIARPMTADALTEWLARS